MSRERDTQEMSRERDCILLALIVSIGVGIIEQRLVHINSRRRLRLRLRLLWWCLRTLGFVRSNRIKIPLETAVVHALVLRHTESVR